MARAIQAAVLVAIIGFSSPAAAQAVSGSYEGQYECDSQWAAFSVTLTERGAAISGEGTFPSRRYNLRRKGVGRLLPGPRRIPTTNEPIPLEGRFESGPGSLTFRTRSELLLAANGEERRMTFTGTRAANGYIRGTLDDPACGRFVLVPTTVQGNARYAAQLEAGEMRRENVLREQEQRRATERDARIRAGWVSPALSPSGGQIQYPHEMLEYYDATMAAPANPSADIWAIDELYQRLRDSDYKCIGTADVVWRGSAGTATTSLFGTKSYVVECRGDCTGLTYRTAGGTHSGKSRPYPTITMQGQVFANPRQIEWTFQRTATAGAPPQIRIHTWSNSLGDYGPRCRID